MTDKQITGLTQAEVDQRIQNGQVNQAIDDQSKTATQIIRENVFTYFNLIFAILAVLLVFVGAWNVTSDCFKHDYRYCAGASC